MTRHILPLLILTLSTILCAGAALAATFEWDQCMGDGCGPEMITIPEQPRFDFDNNITVDESIVEYSIAFNDNFEYMTIGTQTGIISVDLPAFYLGTDKYRIRKNSELNPYLLIARNKSKSSDSISSGFYFNITNVNEPPVVSLCSPSSAPENCTPAQEDIYENTTLTFDIEYYDNDPEEWADVSAWWYVNGVLEEHDESNTYAQFVRYFGYDSAGRYNVSVYMNDSGTPTLATDTYQWNFTVYSINRPPHFTENTSSVAPGSTRSGYPQIHIIESQQVNLSVNYTDPDWDNAPSEFEFYLTNITWYVDGVEQKHVVHMNDSWFLFNTSYETVLPPDTTALFNITAVINDSLLTNSTTWFVNVSNVNQQPNITALYFGDRTYVSGDTITVYEGMVNTTAFSFSDLDDDVDSYSISMDDAVLAWSNETTITWNFSSSGTHNITFFVNDSGGSSGISKNDTAWLEVSVINNTPPTIDTFSILNSSGGSAYYEGDLLNVTFTFSDNEDNTNSTWIRLDQEYLNHTHQEGAADATYVLNFSSRGVYNISVFVNDTEGLFDMDWNASIEVLPTEVPPFFEEIYINDGGPLIYITEEGQVVAHEEYSTLFIQFPVDDANGEATIDTCSAYKDGSPHTVTGGAPDCYLLFSMDWESEGMYLFNLTVNDTSGLSNHTFFYLNISNNTAPQIDTFNITNSTGGSSFSEGDQLNIGFNFTDTYQNEDTWIIAVNGSDVATTRSGQWIRAAYPLDYSSAALYNVSIFINDTQGLSTTQYNDTIQVEETNVPPTIEERTVAFTNGSVLAVAEGDTVISEESSGTQTNVLNITFIAEDLNGNNTLQSPLILIDNISVPVSTSQENMFWHPWQLNFSSEGTHTVNISVSDEVQNASSFFFIKVQNNTAPSLDSLTITNSTGGTYFSENDTLQITIAASDQNNNMHTIALYNNMTGSLELWGTGANQQHTFTYGEQGRYNITAVVNDSEGLSARAWTSIYVNKSYRTPQITKYEFQGFQLDNGNTAVSIYETQSVNYTISAYDADGDIQNLSFLQNGTPLDPTCVWTSPPFENRSRQWETGFGDAGVWNLTAYAIDSRGLEAFYWTIATVQENTAPQISNFTIQNSSGGHQFSEGDLFNISATLTDSQNNIAAYQIRLNGSVIPSSIQGSVLTALHPLNYSSRGTWNISVFVNDTEGLSDIEYNDTISVIGIERAPSIVFPILGYNQTDQVAIAQDSTVTIAEGMQFNMTVVVEDENGDNTIASLDVTKNGTPFDICSPISAHTWSCQWDINYSVQGIWNISLSAYDNTGLKGQGAFYVSIEDNVAPVITSYQVFNATGGTTIREGSWFIANMTYTDANTNLDNWHIEYDGVQNAVDHWNISLEYGQRGLKTIEYYVEDTQGLNDTEQMIIDIQPTNFAPVIDVAVFEIDNGSRYTYVSGATPTVSIHEGQRMNITFNATDLNNDIDSYQIQVDDTVVGQTDWEWNTTFQDAGTYLVNLTVNDSLSAKDILPLTVVVVNNTAPSITSFSVLNSTGGQYYREGDLLDIQFTFNDTGHNQDTAAISLDNTEISTELQGTSVNATYLLNYSSRGTVNISVFINDTEGLAATRYNDTITIHPTEMPPSITEMRISGDGFNQLITDGATKSLREGEWITLSINSSDPNGADTIAETAIHLNGSLLGNCSTQSCTKTWTSDFSDAGIWRMNATVRDQTGLRTTYSFLLNISNNTAPRLQSLDILNSSGGTTYTEGDAIDIKAVFIDTYDNIINVSLYRNTTRICVNGTFNGEFSCRVVWPVNYTSRGTYKIRASATDQEGLQADNETTIVRHPTEIAPQIDYMILNASRSGSARPAEESAVSVHEGEDINITAVASDLNGNATLDTYRIRQQNIIESWDRQIRWHDAELDYDDAGNYTYSFVVTDASGLSTTANFTMQIVDNQAPVIEYFNVTNSTGGTVFPQGSLATIRINCSDAARNMQNIRATLDGNIIFSRSNYSDSLHKEIAYQIPYSLSGLKNMTLYLDDEEGLQTGDTLPVQITSTNAPPQIVNATATMHNTSFEVAHQQTLQTSVNSTIHLSFNISDENDEDTHAARIYVDSIQRSDSRNFTFQTDPLQERTYNISFFVNDSSGAHDWLNFSVATASNQAPVIHNFSVTAVNGTNFTEGGYVQLYVNATDVNNNIVRYNISRNGTQIASAANVTYQIPYSWRGTQKLQALITDSEGATDNANVTIQVAGTEMPPEVRNPTAGDTNLSAGQYVTSFTEGQTVILRFDPYDPNGEETINVSQIIMNSTLGYVEHNLSSYSFALSSGTGGKIINVTYLIRDQTNRTDRFSFMLIPQTVISQTEPRSSSGGRSSSGSSGSMAPAKPKVADIKISEKVPIELEENTTLIEEIVIHNPGQRYLENLSLRYSLQGIAASGVQVEIMEHNTSIAPNGSVRVKVRIRSTSSEPFNITFDASGDGGASALMQDSAVIYVNSRSKKEVDRKEIETTATMIDRMLKDNVECLELSDMVVEAQGLAEAGRFAQARAMLEDARQECMERTQRKFDNLDARIIKQDTGIYKIIVYAILALLFLLMLPSVYIVYRKIKKRSKPVKVQEEEIDKFLEEFYE